MIFHINSSDCFDSWRAVSITYPSSILKSSFEYKYKANTSLYYLIQNGNLQLCMIKTNYSFLVKYTKFQWLNN